MAECGRGYEHLEPLLDELAGLPADDDRRRRVRDELIAGFMPMAVHIARRYSGRGEPFDDLAQIATIGLLRAVERFDPTQGSDFSSYAAPTIAGEVKRYFRDSAWSVKTPRSVKDRFVVVNAAISRTAQDLGRAPTAGELAMHLEMSREDVLEAIAARSSYRSGSLDQVLGERDDDSRIDFLGVIDTGFEQVEVREMVRELVSSLPEREQTMIVLRFVHEKTQAEIAAEFGISKMHVSRLLHRSFDQMRVHVERRWSPGDDTSCRA